MSFISSVVSCLRNQAPPSIWEVWKNAENKSNLVKLPGEADEFCFSFMAVFFSENTKEIKKLLENHS